MSIVLSQLRGFFSSSLAFVFLIAGLMLLPVDALANISINWATLDGGASATVATGASVSATLNVTTSGSGSADNWYSTEWRISTTPPGAMDCDNTPNYNGDGTYTRSFNITAPSTPGTYNVYFIARNGSNCSNGSSSTFTLTNALVVVTPTPDVLSMVRSSFDPTKANTLVSWLVTFNTSVTGVDAGDFALALGGAASGATITSVTGSGSTWTVNADTGSGAPGTVRLDLVDNDSIKNSSNVALGGAGVGNGNFSGQSYTLLQAVCSGADIIFCDDFERSNPESVGNGWSVTENNASNCSGTSGNRRCAGIDSDIPPFDTYSNPRANPTRSMFTRWDRVWVTSPTINMAGRPGGQFSFWMRRGHDDFSECPEASGENYLVEYYASDNTWKSLAQYPSSPTAALCDGRIWTPTIELPDDALHANFKLRFYQPSGSGDSGSGGATGVRGYDYWHMDNVIIREKISPSFTGAFCDNFEGGLGRWSITSEGAPNGATIGDADLGTLTSLSPSHSLDLRWGYVSASTFKTDMTNISGNITYWVKSGTTADRDPDNGEDLIVEYKNSSNSWVTLATYPGNATAGTEYNASHPLPADAKHANFRLRFRHLNASGYNRDYWHVDDACVGDPIPTVDLALTKARTGELVPGSQVTYTLTAKNNNGPGTLAGSVEVVDTLPSGLSYVGAAGSGWVCSANAQIVTCNWSGTLVPNATAPALTLTVAVSPSASGTLTNSATISGTVNDNNSTNNTATDSGNVITATLLAEYHFEDPSWNGTAGELKDTAGYPGGPYNGAALTSGSPPLPTAALAEPARAGTTGTCGYATLPGPTANGGAFTISNLPVSLAAGAKTSVAFWMYWDGTEGVMPIGWTAHDLWLQNGSFGFNTANTDIYGVSSTGLANTWHHVVAVFTNGSVTSNLLFIDGVQQTLSQRQGTPLNANAVVASTLRVGGWTTDSGYRFASRIDELKVYKDALVLADATALYNETHPCTPAVDHYELSLPTSSISCLGTTVTVTACAPSTSPCNSPSAVVGGKTATLAASGGTLGSPVVFNASGIASGTLSYPTAPDATAVTVTLSGEEVMAVAARKCCPNGANCVVANMCSTTFNTAGFIVTPAANSTTVATIPFQEAGTASSTYYLRAVKTSDNSAHTCGAAFSGPQNVDFAYECNNPLTCYGSNLVSVTGSSTTVISRNNNGGASGAYSYTAVPMSFDANGNAPFSFVYNDSGLITLRMRKVLAADNSAVPPIAAATLTSNTNAFVVKPAGFVLSGIRQTASPNLVNPFPRVTNAQGARFVMAGEEFSATVTALTASGRTTAIANANTNVDPVVNCGSMPLDCTPNYGQEISPEGVKLASTLVTGLGLSANPALNNNTAFGTFSNGVASGTTFSWDEVGIITLTPSVGDGNFLGAGNITGTASGNVGRFFPHHFDLKNPILVNRSDLPGAATGSIAAGSAALTMSATNNLAVGNTIVIAGAGAAGSPLTATVTAINGNILTLNTAAGTAVAAAYVRYFPAWNRTGTITAGTNPLTLSSAANLALGDTVVIAGAGLNGGALTAQATAIAGTVVTINANAPTTVAGSPVGFSNGYTYMDEAFGVYFELTARNAAGGTTANYVSSAVAANNFAKLDAAGAAWLTLGHNNTIGVGAVSGATPLATRLTMVGAPISPSGGFVGGVGSFAGNMQLNLRTMAPAAPAITTVLPSPPNPLSVYGPYDPMILGVAPQDEDGVQLGAFNVNTLGTTVAPERSLIGVMRQRFGRVSLSNAFGSELLPLPVTARLQFWNGLAWQQNADDSSTAILPAAVVLSNPTRNLSLTPVAETSANFLWPSARRGNLGLRLAATGGGKNGSVVVTVTPPAWLTFDWDGNGTHDNDPSARATFGVYKNNFIFLRENY